MGNIWTAEQSNNSEQEGSDLIAEQSNNSEQEGSDLIAEQCGDTFVLENDDSDFSFFDEEVWDLIHRYEESSEESYSSTTDQEKCYDPQDRTLTFVDGDDELDVLCIGYKSLRAKMSCGHTVTPMSLTDHCRWLLDQGQCRFVCGLPKCDLEWSFEEVCKMALLTLEEVEEFEEKRFSNTAKHDLGIRECPGCKIYVMRTDLSDLSVRCTVCTAKNNSTYRFCWQCLKEWKGPYPRLERCDNDDCDRPLKILKTCTDIVFKAVKGVTGCPSIRACPTCGELVRHDGTKCKNVVCTQCKVEFCFVCLKITTECQKINLHSYYKVCSSGVAPRQTSIPVRQSR